MSGRGESQREAALVGGEAGDGDARADGGAAGAEGHGLGRPAVVAQRGEQRIDGTGGGAHLVAGGGEPAGAVPVADQVVTLVVSHRPGDVGAGSRALPATIVSTIVVRESGRSGGKRRRLRWSSCR